MLRKCVHHGTADQWIHYFLIHHQYSLWLQDQCLFLDVWWGNILKFLKYGISNKKDRADDALCEDVLDKGDAETEDVADNDSYADYYDDSPATHEIPNYD